ncbi:MAG: AAA family ATPase [Planctomycetes bacterium]|nr:AAA family ATPase [Planctomycetota bacterium]
MDELILENFRCFHGSHKVPIKPLTLLVGENSTGKTSFLAAIRIAHQLASGKPVDFNSEPFNLGAYEQIASSSVGKTGQSDNFSVGCSLSRNGSELMRCIGLFSQSDSQPELDKITVEYNIAKIEALRTSGNNVDCNITNKQTNKVVKKTFSDSTSRHSISLGILIRSEFLYDKAIKQLLHGFYAFFPPPRADSNEPWAMAPVRSKPERTYNPVMDIPDAQGTHVPMRLAIIAAKPDKWDSLHTALSRFGKASGLFKTISPRRKGSSSSDPFQIMVELPGGKRNLIDVGYGVSQVLPFLVECMTRETGIFLLQQPEVHLHPRAQAEFGSFIGELAAQGKKEFILETHSDHLIDRVRMDIRDKKNRLKPEDVQILYFERKTNSPWIDIRQIYIDESGELVNVPDSYRSFFLKEQERFLGI